MFLACVLGQVTDRYIKAIERFGSDKLDARIGGILALERIARDSARVISAFIREHSPSKWPPAERYEPALTPTPGTLLPDPTVRA